MRKTSRRWVYPSLEVGRDQLRADAEALKVSPRVAAMLHRRGIVDLREADAFLRPHRGQLHDPFLIYGVHEACEVVHKALAQGHLVTLYGDYDVDGTCATALLWWVFKKLKARVRYHVPDRQQGYGLSREGIDAAKAAGSQLILTMDQGISAHEEIDYAKSLGIDVVVTDHHLPPKTLPAAAAIVHPKLGKGYPNPHLCGSAVAFQFGIALLRSSENSALRESADGYRDNCIDLAAIATLADVVPLQGENRALVALGLEQMAKTRHPGVRAMLEIGGWSGPKVEVDDVSFKVAPMMNAAGRLAGPEATFETLLTRSPARARELAQELHGLNLERRRLTEELMDEAQAQAASFRNLPIGVLDLDRDEVGIVGLVAGRLKEAYWKPFVVLARKGPEWVGSCRSVEGFDIKAALDEVAETLERHGGHAQAAGLTVLDTNLEAFRERLVEAVRESLDPDVLVPRLAIEEVLDPKALTWDLVEDVEQLAPFGKDNPAPVFALEGLAIEAVKTMGKQKKHIRVLSKSLPRGVDPVGFHMASLMDALGGPAGGLDLAFQVGRNTFAGRTRLQLRLEDLKSPTPPS